MNEWIDKLKLNEKEINDEKISFRQAICDLSASDFEYQNFDSGFVILVYTEIPFDHKNKLDSLRKRASLFMFVCTFDSILWKEMKRNKGNGQFCKGKKSRILADSYSISIIVFLSERGLSLLFLSFLSLLLLFSFLLTWNLYFRLW